MVQAMHDDPVLLQFEEHGTLTLYASKANLTHEPVAHALPLNASALATTLRGDPPGPLGLEHAIEQIEDAIMPARALTIGATRLVLADAALHALVAGAGSPSADEFTLGRDAVERLFERLAARAQGRPAAQDPLPTDPASSAALLLAREALHHWGLETLSVRRS